MSTDPPPVEPPPVGPPPVDPPQAGEGDRPARRRDLPAALLIGVLTLLLGFAFTVQVRNSDDEQVLAGAREEDLVRIVDEVSSRGVRLREQIADQRSALRQLTSSDSETASALEEAGTRAAALGVLNGTAPAEGPGLRMTLRDPDDGLRVTDLIDVIQELRGAGAETMQFDGVRVGLSTAVTGTAGALLIDGRPVTAPYEVLVLGSPQDLETALNIPGGVVQAVGSRGGSVTIEQVPELLVDALRPLPEAQYAAPDDDD
ncbi:Uncharacterized conserved protein YlxW, UPF0749 family [Blastococcus aggregatus]|uniref:Uncharacterized conserved protein YlxW, UPF0749 family n=1 Tax=Blastococcus aggregatus TaxID=38502 RepID=A0A285V5H4_9ACTN|nr:DUF881 domain-containing protein [Blastococcus aggregatus]SOC49365.1 Uncharacterized conserved protein YlxW, UPF0749 family [Blastococcus aggregatus]